MTSLVKAASQLLQHLLTEYQLAIQKRSQILCGLLTLLGRSLALAKQDSSASQSDCEAPKDGHVEGGVQGDIFKEVFDSLRGSLKKLLRASGRLQCASETYCHEEFQVQFRLKKNSNFNAIYINWREDQTTLWNVSIARSY